MKTFSKLTKGLHRFRKTFPKLTKGLNKFRKTFPKLKKGLPKVKKQAHQGSFVPNTVIGDPLSSNETGKACQVKSPWSISANGAANETPSGVVLWYANAPLALILTGLRILPKPLGINA